MIGWFGEDAAEWVVDRASDAGDAFSSVASEIPFAPELAAAIKDVINGPLRDFARTPYGLTVLRALSTTVYGPLAWTIGPQLASVAFAAPGLARGQDFWEAWFTEASYRAEKAAEIGGAGAFSSYAADAARIVKILLSTPRSQWVNLARSELARRFGVDEATIAAALAIVGDWSPDEVHEELRNYDPLTGKHFLSLGRRRPRDPSAPRATACQSYDDAVKRGQDPAIVAALARKCRAELAAPSSSPSSATAAAEPVTDRPRTGTAGNVALVGLIGAAGAALVWFYMGERR